MERIIEDRFGGMGRVRDQENGVDNKGYVGRDGEGERRSRG